MCTQIMVAIILLLWLNTFNHHGSTHRLSADFPEDNLSLSNTVQCYSLVQNIDVTLFTVGMCSLLCWCNDTAP